MEKTGKFSAAARAAAITSRRRTEIQRKLERSQIGVFATRRDSDFGWELRQFGSLVVARGDQTYPSSDAAIAAGEQAKAGLSEEQLANIKSLQVGARRKAPL